VAVLAVTFDLAQAVTAAVAAREDLQLVSAEGASDVIALAETKVGVPLRRAWSWEGLAGVSVHFHYGDQDGLALVRSMLPTAGPLWLFVTNDRPPPWICVRGASETLCWLLGELPLVEYFVVADDGDWIMFDTHHNVFVGVGARCPLRAKVDPAASAGTDLAVRGGAP
jgi:hypothetical protein